MGQFADDMDAISVYTSGICHCSVCAPRQMPRGRVEAAVNGANPTGIEPQWKISEEDFHTGEPNPCLCNQEPKDRLHYLLKC